MRRVVSLYRSSVGKKVLMAVTGLILFLFLIAHMVGNLKVFFGPGEYNAYAEYLRTVGYPALPNGSALWVVRVVLILCVAVHMVAAFQTWAQSRGARSVGYRKTENLSFSYASRTMRWGGIIIALFVVYHILHFTTGTLHSDFVKGDVYHNFVVAFKRPLVLAIYLVAQGALCLHLYHGLWSVTQTLGANHPRYNRFRRPLAALFALGIFAGFIIPPVMVFVGVIS